MKKAFSLLLVATSLFLFAACGARFRVVSGQKSTLQAEETTALMLEEETAKNDASNMTGEELYDYLAPIFGQFGSGITKDGVKLSILYQFTLSEGSQKLIVRMDNAYEGIEGTFGTYYAFMDLDEGVIAYIDAPVCNSSDESKALYDEFLVFCKRAGITPEQMVAVLDYYATIADPEIVSTKDTDTEETDGSTEDMTFGQKNALQCAKDYLSHMPFSYDGLVEQLEYEKFSHEDAVFAADHCGADWNEQAAKSAKSYLEHMSFSRDGLIDQLVYEGFTYEQAVYGVEKNGY